MNAGAKTTSKTWCTFCKRYYLDDATVALPQCPYCGAPSR